MIENEIGDSLTILPDKSKDLVDDSKADWITAMFYTKARHEMLVKRADLIANFQFVSNLLTILFFAVFIIPPYIFYKLGDIRYSIGSIPLLLLLFIGYWKFSVAALRRVNTFENITIYGILLEEKRLETVRKLDRESSTQHVLSSQVEEGAFPRILAILFGRKHSNR